MLKMVIKRLFGGLILLTGIILCGWFIYNQIWPTEEFKSGFRSIFQLIFPLACLFVGWKWVRYEGKGIEEVTPPDLKCQELDESVVIAKNTISIFVQEVDKGIDGAYIKFPLKTPQGLIEHIWSYVHFFREDQFNVSLVNKPYDDQQQSEGRHNVPLSDVEDWQIIQPDNKIKGAFSLIALFKHHENRGLKLTPRMKKQKAQLIDAR